MEREQMRVISYLNISPEQKPLLAAKWHHWRTRRTRLDKTLAAAFNSFGQSLPSSEDLPAGLMSALERYAPNDQEGGGEALAELLGQLEREGSENESKSGVMHEARGPEPGGAGEAQGFVPVHRFVPSSGVADDFKHGAVFSFRMNNYRSSSWLSVFLKHL